jgi:siroheme synthase
MGWVRRRWLTRDVDGQSYTLTSYAMQALGLVQSLTRDRVNLSEHRIKNIVETANRLNAGSNPDRDARIARLRVQIAQQQAELERLEAGEPIAPVTADFILEGLVELQDLVSGLPIEFARVGEVVEALQDRLREDFRADERPPGEIVADFLVRADDLAAPRIPLPAK